MKDLQPSEVANHKPLLTTLVGDACTESPDVVGALLRHTFNDRFEVRVHTRGQVQDVIIAASRRPYDLFVLVLDNLTSRGLDPEQDRYRIHRAAELVPYLKTTYNQPVAVITASAPNTLLHWLEQAGADVILPVPFSIEQFADLVNCCLTERFVHA